MSQKRVIASVVFIYVANEKDSVYDVTVSIDSSPPTAI